MAKKFFYCEHCGTELVYRRRALRNKGIIVDTIDLHECNMANLSNIKDIEKPKDPIQKEHEESLRKPRNIDQTLFDSPALMDFRDSKDKKALSSSAPTSLLNSMRSMRGTPPTNNFNDLDDKGE